MAIAVLGGLMWSYQFTLSDMARNWQNDDNYSVGMLVPLIAAYVVWIGRDVLRQVVLKPAWLLGICAIGLSQAIRFEGLADLRESIERYSFVFNLGGLVLLVMGWQMFYRVRWILLFLLLMVPVPGTIHNIISAPLQNLATTGAVFTLELVGITVSREGYVMVLNNEVPIAVAEACSGLRLLTAFIVVACAMAFMIGRPSWQRAVLVLSSIPIAIMCNLIRLVITALLFLWTTSEVAERFFHDFAGLTMMPLAVGLLAVELWVMGKLIIEDEQSDASAAPAGQPVRGE
jgi:exosortase